jgi:hypothetical protein
MAFDTTVSKTGCTEAAWALLMIFKTSEAAVSRSSASFRSWARRTISDSEPVSDELRGLAVPLARFGVASVRRRDLTEPAPGAPSHDLARGSGERIVPGSARAPEVAGYELR